MKECWRFDSPEVIFENPRQHEHLHIHCLEHIAAAGHASAVRPCRQLRHRQICAVALVVPHNDGTGLPGPSVNDVAGTGVGLKPRALQSALT